MSGRTRLGVAAAVSVLLAGATIAIVLALGDDGQRGQRALPTPPPRKAWQSPLDHLLVERQWLDHVGTAAVGPGYACPVVLPRSRPRVLRSARLVVFVADDAAERRARELVERLAWPDRRARVERTSPRFRMHVMERIRDAVVDAIPAHSANLGVGLMGFVELRRGECPPLAISVQRPGRTTPAVERWVADAVRRYGADRIRVHRSDGPNVPA